MGTRRRSGAFLALALMAIATPAWASDDALPDRDLLLEFVRHNLEQLPSGQIYIARPHVRPVDDWVASDAIESDIEAMATEAFASDVPAPDIILVDREPDDFTFAYKAYVNLVEGLDEDERVGLWSKAITASAPCDTSFARDYLAVVSVASVDDASSCIGDGLYWFRGVRTRFNVFAELPVSELTRAADDLLVAALRDCAPLGWLDRQAHTCVLTSVSPPPPPPIPKSEAVPQVVAEASPAAGRMRP